MNEKSVKRYIGTLKEHGDPSAYDLVKKVAQYAGSYRVHVSANEYARPGVNDGYKKWEDILESGRSYMVGETTPMKDYLRHNTSRLTYWQQLAYAYCKENPGDKLVLDNDRLAWHVYARGEYVTFSLPHHDAGGEKYWVSLNGQSRVLVDED